MPKDYSKSDKELENLSYEVSDRLVPGLRPSVVVDVDNLVIGDAEKLVKLIEKSHPEASYESRFHVDSDSDPRFVGALHLRRKS